MLDFISLVLAILAVGAFAALLQFFVLAFCSPNRPKEYHESPWNDSYTYDK